MTNHPEENNEDSLMQAEKQGDIAPSRKYILTLNNSLKVEIASFRYC